MDLTESILRLLLAAALGGLIGIEREYRDKSAGFRTLILISVGSALFSIVSIQLAFTFGEQFGVDPGRVISYVVSGIGFLGGGVIIKNGIDIKGLTTAASIWLTAAVGMSAGTGQYELALIATAIVMAALVVLPAIEHRIDALHEYHHYIITASKLATLDEILLLFERNNIQIFHYEKSKSQKDYKITIDADAKPQQLRDLDEKLLNRKDVISFE